MRWPAYSDYKVTDLEWLGRIPSHWRVVRFKYLFQEVDERNGDAPVGVMLSVSGYRGVEKKEYEDDNKRRTDEELRDYRVVRPGWLAVNTMWLNYAGLGVSSLTGHVSPAYRAYIPRKPIHSQYAHHLLRSSVYVSGYTKYLQGIRPNSLQMKTEDFESFPVVLPTLEEQCHIARFLDHETARIDALIEEQQRLIDLLQEKRQAIISHAVTKGLDPDVPMKDSGVEWLGRIPKHWRTARLKHLVARESGAIRPGPFGSQIKGDDFLASSEYPVYNQSTVIADDFSRSAYISKEKFEELRAFKTAPRDVLITARGTIGRLAIVPEAVPVGVIHPCLIRVRLDERVGVAEFTGAVFRFTPIAIEQLRLSSNATTIDVVYAGTLSDVWLAIPPISEQREIIRNIQYQTLRIDDALNEARKLIGVLKERRSALISAAVTGKIDVRDWKPQNASVESELPHAAETEAPYG